MLFLVVLIDIVLRTCQHPVALLIKDESLFLVEGELALTVGGAITEHANQSIGTNTISTCT